MKALLVAVALCLVGTGFAQKRECKAPMCMIACQYGFALGENGCPRCSCRTRDQATECVLQREAARKSNVLGSLVPRCDIFGDYVAKQCRENFCACFTRDGKPFTAWKIESEAKKLRCDCMSELQESANGGKIGAFQPKCAFDGSYEKVQCWGSTGHCWCVNPETGEKTSEPVRGTPNC